MGGVLCSRQKPSRVIIQGLDAAGKTTLLYRLKLGEVVTTIPTIGFNVETLHCRGLEINAWDLGGRDKIRPLFRHYYPGTEGFIFIVDSTDHERLDDALTEMQDMILLDEDVTRDTVVMVLANKQDVENALSPAEIETRLQKFHEKCDRKLTVSVFVMPCSATSPDVKPLWLAFNHFVKMIKLKREGMLENGLIPLAWETANQEAQSEKTSADDVNMFHRLKSSILKNPFQVMKSMLFY